MVTYTLHDLTDHIRQVLALNFTEPLWITAEVAHAGLSKGHCYVELVQKNTTTDEPLAQASAVLWAQDLRRLRHQADADPALLLQAGLQLRLQVRVDFHERFGLKLQILDIDPAFTFGQLEIERQKTIQALRQQQLLDRNGLLPLPLVLQRIAVLSSDTAAGYQDFQKQLHENDWGYAFHCTLFPCAVQGRNAVPELLAALDSIRLHPTDFDAVVIVRGGGARLDLAAFDSLELAQSAATFPLPVLCGVGHETDQSVLDAVAHTALKTPTATADFILQHNLQFEMAVARCAELLKRQASNLLTEQHFAVERCKATLGFALRETLHAQRRQIDLLAAQLPQATTQRLRLEHNILEQAAALCASLDPKRVLQRGYSLTLKNGLPLRHAKDTAPGDVLETRLSDGQVVSKVV